jgi:type IV pilus assembly protein PilE
MGATAVKKSDGFTLIELMIVLIVIGVLAAIVYPSYQKYILKSHRATAINAVLDVASREARYYTTNNNYTSSMTALGYSADPYPVANGTDSYWYNVNLLSVTAATSTAPAHFTVQAVPTGGQNNDTCGTFTYTDMGVKAVTSGSLSDCWAQ